MTGGRRNDQWQPEGEKIGAGLGEGTRAGLF
jgi:hypothetical protein